MGQRVNGSQPTIIPDIALIKPACNQSLNSLGPVISHGMPQKHFQYARPITEKFSNFSKFFLDIMYKCVFSITAAGGVAPVLGAESSADTAISKFDSVYIRDRHYKC